MPDLPTIEQMEQIEQTMLGTWWVFCGTLILFMQIGFMMFEAGCVRGETKSGIAIKNIFMLMASFLGFTLVGYHLVYNDSEYLIFGNLFGASSSPLANSNEWQYCQTGYAVICATIVSGAIAGRTTLLSNVIVAFCMAALIYPVYAHWVWGGGWLAKQWFFHDFAGSAVVHVIGGVCAAVGAFVTGPRFHRSYRSASSLDRYVLAIQEPLGPRDLSIAAYGVMFMLIGWLGFNGGSIRAFSEVEVVNLHDGVAFLFLATLSAGAGGCVCVCVLEFARHYVFSDRADLQQRSEMKIDPFALLSGALGGMVAVTAVCDICETPLQAIGVGCVGGSCTWVTSRIVLLVLRLDDPVDAIAIHFGGGTAGVLLASGEAEATFAGQCLGLAAAIAYCGLMSYVMFALLDRCGWLRCTLGREDKGLSFVAVKERLPERHDPGERPELPEKLASQARRQRRFIKKSWVFCMAVVTLLIVRLLADIVLNLIKSASGE